MRIAISGSHATGKSTLATQLAGRCPSLTLVEEPYHALAAEGHVFSATPDADDFEAMLERSLADFDDSRRNGIDVLFDRTPADYLAYLSVSDGATDRTRSWVPHVKAAIASLDLLLFLPIERPERVAVVGDHPRLRRRIDAVLRSMLIEDEWGFGAVAVEITGPTDDRVEVALRHSGLARFGERTAGRDTV